MTHFQRKLVLLGLCSTGTLFASSCAAGQIIDTIFAALNIVSVWV